MSAFLEIVGKGNLCLIPKLIRPFHPIKIQLNFNFKPNRKIALKGLPETQLTL